MNFISRGSILVALAAVGASAQAITVDLVSVGTYNNSFGPYYTTSEGVVFSDLPSLPASATSLSFYDHYTPNYGTATYTSGMNKLVLDIDVTNFDLDPGMGATSSMVGTWTLDKAMSSSAYQGYNGSGTISAGYNQLAGALSITTVVGNLTPAVPEPATYAVLGIGVIGMLRRRNRR